MLLLLRRCLSVAAPAASAGPPGGPGASSSSASSQSKLLALLSPKEAAKLRASQARFAPSPSVLGEPRGASGATSSAGSSAGSSVSNRQRFRQTPVTPQLLQRLEAEQLGQQRRTGRARERRRTPKVAQTPVDLAEAAVFKRNFKFIAGADVKTSFPAGDLAEVAFLGRSNVGKSSLLNALASTTIVRVSNTPGLTRALNFFQANKMGMLVDMPGYGFAFAKDTDKARWQELIRSYLTERKQLRRLFLLLDARHGVKVNDKQVMDTLDALKVKYQVVLTKADLVPRVDLARRYLLVREEIANKKHSIDDVLMVSSHTGAGIAKLRRVVRQILQPAWRSPEVVAPAAAAADAEEQVATSAAAAPHTDRQRPRNFSKAPHRDHAQRREKRRNHGDDNRDDKRDFSRGDKRGFGNDRRNKRDKTPREPQLFMQKPKSKKPASFGRSKGQSSRRPQPSAARSKPLIQIGRSNDGTWARDERRTKR